MRKPKIVIPSIRRHVKFIFILFLLFSGVLFISYQPLAHVVHKKNKLIITPVETSAEENPASQEPASQENAGSIVPQNNMENLPQGTMNSETNVIDETKPPILVGLLLPDSRTPRFELYDKPIFEQKLKSLGNFEVVYYNANENSALQIKQADALFSKGIKVLVIAVVDASQAYRIIEKANRLDIPVVAYDRIIPNAKIAYFVSFDARKVGELQGRYLVNKLDMDQADGGLIVLNGPPQDPNSRLFEEGAAKFLNNRKYPILASYQVPGWKGDRARNWLSDQIPSFQENIAGIYAANDVLAGAAVDALKMAEVNIPPITGQDANLDAVQRILIGEQFMTVYKNFKAVAENAARAVYGLVMENRVAGNTIVNGVPASLFPVTAITVDNLNILIKEGMYTTDQICTADFMEACDKAGLTSKEE